MWTLRERGSTVKTATRVVAASLALSIGVLVAPGFALAGQAQGSHNGGPVAGGTTLGVSRPVALPFPHQPFPVVGGATLGVSRSVAVPFPPQRFVPRQFIRPSFPVAVVAGAPAVAYAAPAYDQAYYPPPYYYQQPQVVVQPAPIYVERNEQPQPQESFWYYCPNTKAYYPSVPSCSEAWVKVPPRSE